MRHLIEERIVEVPVTFVNEDFTTFQAGRFLELYRASNSIKQLDKSLSKDSNFNKIVNFFKSR
jgi:hypothetical protein